MATVILLALSAVVLRCIVLVVRERAVIAHQAALDIRMQALANGEADNVAPIGPAPSRSVPRIVLSDALEAAVQAQASPPGPLRRALLDRAVWESAVAASARPFWGEASTVAAFALALRDGPDVAPTRSAFAASYRQSPYLRHVGPWRISHGFAQWGGLDRATRARLVDEAVWLARDDEAMRAVVFPLARQSGGYRPFMLRWLRMRVGDADFAPVDRPAFLPDRAVPAMVVPGAKGSVG